MFLKNKSYTRWWAPLLGAIAGAEVALKGLDANKGQADFVMKLSLSVGVGFAGGLIVMFVDPSPPKPGDPAVNQARSGARPTLVGNVLCALSLIFFFMPFFSVVISCLALMCNWKVKGWVRGLSWFGLIIGSVMTYLMIQSWIYQAAHPR